MASASAAPVLAEITVKPASAVRPTESSRRNELLRRPAILVSNWSATSLPKSRAVSGWLSMRSMRIESGPAWRCACENSLRPCCSRECGVSTPVSGSRSASCSTARRLVSASWLACTRRSRLSMRASTSGASAVLPMKSLAPASRARVLVDGSSSPEITTTGSSRMRLFPEARASCSTPKPSSFGMDRSRNTSTIEGSVSSARQPASPSGSSRTANLACRMLRKVARTNFESSTISTVRCGSSAASAMARLIRQVYDDAAVDPGVDEIVEHPRQIAEGDGAAHLLQQSWAHVAGQAPPDVAAQLRRRAVGGVDAEQAHAAQDERHHCRAEGRARRQPDRCDDAVDLHRARRPCQDLTAEIIDRARPGCLIQRSNFRQIEGASEHYFL